MAVQTDNPILACPPGTLMPVEVTNGWSLCLRETDFGLKKYPRDAKAELKLRVLDRKPVLLVAIMVRLGRCDVTTFEHWVNCGHPDGVRLIKTLAMQRFLDLYLYTDRPARSFRLANSDPQLARRVEREVRNRSAWTEAQFKTALDEINHRYHTVAALWWETDQW